MPRDFAALALVLLTACANQELPTAHPPAAPAAPPTPLAAASGPRPPETPKRPVTDEFHGVTVAEDYRWLEAGASPEVARWSEAQNRYARAYLDALPDRAALRARVGELLSSSSADYFDLDFVGGRIFALKDQPPKQQPFLVLLKSPDEPGSERVLVDPNQIDPKGRTTIDFYVPSLDGKKVAVSLSENGTESGTVHVFDVETGQETGDVIPRVNGGTAGGSVAWSADGEGFFYTRYPRAGERPPADLDFYQQVYFHELGTPEAQDRYAIGKEFPRIAEVELESSDDGKYVLAKVANGDGGEWEHYLFTASAKKAGTGTWKQIAKLTDRVVRAEFGRDGSLYLLSLDGAPRGKLLRLSPEKPVLEKAELVVPESAAVIQRFEPTKSRLFVVDLVGGPSQVRVFDLKAPKKPPLLIPIQPVSSVGHVQHLEGDAVLFRNSSYLEPPAWYRFLPDSGKVQKTALFKTSVASFGDAEATREMCTSKDGTLVPLNIVRKKGTPLDGKNPTLLTGYGGYGISLSPYFMPLVRLWLDQGGVYAVANLRGGGEFGESWHRAGNLANKQNVFDDFIACAEHLVKTRVTSPEHLAITGGSNGGLLMGAALTQRPELFKAVVARVGIFDMLRVELTPNGAFNVTEFGTVKDPELFKALYAYSPYHHVTDQTAYPAVIFFTGANDPRVDPYNSRKMLARLQAATSSAAPILLRTSGDTGHGAGTPLSAEIDEATDMYGFLLQELGVPFHGPE